MAEKRVIDLEVKNKGFEEFEGKSKSLKKELRALKEQLQQLDEGSEEFRRLSAEAGALEDRIGDVNARVKALASDTAKLDAAVGGVQAVAGAFGAAQASAALFGSESEELQKQMLRVQAAMTLVTSVQSVANALNKDSALSVAISNSQFATFKTRLLQTAAAQQIQAVATTVASGAMKILNTIMSLNPVLLLVAGITALVGAFAFFTRETESAAEANEKLNETLERQRVILDRNNKALIKAGKDRLEILQAEGASEEALHKQRIDNINNEEIARRNEIQQLLRENAQKAQIFKKAVDDKDAELQKSILKEVRDNENKLKDLQAQESEFRKNRRIEDLNFQKKQDEDRKAEAEKEAAHRKELFEKYKQYQADRLSALRQIRDLELALLREGRDKELAENQEKYKRLIEDTKANEKLLSDEKTKIVQLLRESEFRQKQAIDQKETDEIKLKTKEFQKESIDDLIAQGQAEATVRAEQRDKFLSEEKRLAEERKQLEQQVQAAKLEISKNALSLISDLADLFAKNDERSQKKAFQIKKAAGMATATIDTFQAAQGAYASQMAIPTPDAPIRAAVAAGLAIAQGLGRVAVIAKTKFGGGASSGGASGGGGSVPSVQTQAPNFNIVGNSGTNQLLEGLTNQPLKAFVVAGEVTSGQQLERNKLKTATL